MPAAPLPANEPARLDALRRFGVLDTPPEQGFDDLTRLAATICGTPIALVSLVDEHRQWFKSCVGLDATETPRDAAFCAHAIHRPELLVVPDATADERFADSPLVTGEPHIRFYAGMPLTTSDGLAVGTLCVIDRTPRTLTPAQEDALRALARQVVAQLRLRKQVVEQAKDHETFRVLFEQSSDAHLIFDERDGIIDCNHAAVAMLRLASKAEVIALHPAVLSPEFQPCGRRSLEKCVDMDATALRDGYHRFDWTHRRADGEEFPCEVTLTPVQLHGRSVLLVVWHDLTERKRAEEALRASEQKFRAIFDSTFQYIGLLSPDGAVLEANRVALVSAGVALADVEGKPFWECVWWAHNPDLQALLKHGIEQAAGGEFVRFEATHPLADGTLATIDFSLTPIRDATGAVVLLVPEGRDVSDRKRAEDRLRESEGRFQAFMDNSPVVAFMKDADGRYTYVNRPLERRFGKPATFWLGKTDAELFPDQYSGVWRDNDLRVLATGQAEELSESLPTDDGLTHWTTYKFPFHDLAGRVYLAGLGVDVTEKRRADERLRESEGRFRAVVEQAADAVFLTAPDGTVADVNRRACDSLGYTRDELIGSTFRRFDPFLNGGSHARLLTDLEAGRTVCFETAHRRKDGSEFPVEIRMGQVDLNGLPHRLSIARDITDRKRAEDALRESETRFRSVVDELAEGVVLLDADTRAVVQANQAFLDLTGYTADEFAALTQYDFVAHPKADIDARMAAIVRDGRADLGFRTYRRKDGHTVDVSVSGSRLELGGRAVLCLLVRDMTPVKAAEAALRATEERFRAAMEGSLDAVFFLTAERDGGGRITDFRFADLNARGAALISRERAEVLGRRLCELLPVNRTAGFFDKYARVVETGQTLEEEFAIAADTVTAAWLHHQVVKVGDGVAITSRDVTARNRAEAELRASEERLRTLGDNLPDGVVYQYVIDPAGGHHFPHMSRGIERLTGVSAADIMADPNALIALNHPDDVPGLVVAIAESQAALTPFEHELRISHRDGSVRWFHARSAPRRLPDGGTAWDGVMTDVTARKRAEDELRGSEERFDLAVRGSQDGLWDWDLRTGRVYFSPRWKEMLGYAEGEVAAHVDEWRRLTHPDDLVLAEAALRAYFARTAPRYGLEVRMRHKDGTFRWVFTRGMALFAADGTPVRMAGSHTDVTAVKRVEEELRRNEAQLLAYQKELEVANARLHTLATTDRLTGVNNRGAFNDRLSEEFDRAVRHDHPLSVVLLDVDHFKQFNDTFGHPAGDAVLQRVADLLQDTVRGTDFVARYGGEEFAVLLPDTDYGGAMVLAERLRRAVAGGSWDKRPVTISVGVSTLSPTTADAAALVQEADQALYRSKQAGRNRVHHGSSVLSQAATVRA
jgi:diguanylate cyclase (GGDEF)-like protein/PAS domain S-box-containing protein